MGRARVFDVSPLSSQARLLLQQLLQPLPQLLQNQQLLSQLQVHLVLWCYLRLLLFLLFLLRLILSTVHSPTVSQLLRFRCRL